MKARERVRIIAAVAAALVVGFLIAIKSANPWLIGIAPTLLAVWLLLVSYHGYFLLRASRWHRRQQEEKEALAKVAIPLNVKKPEAFGGVEAIDDVQKRVLQKAPDYQGRFRVVAITVALAPPPALLFLSVQTLFFPHGGPYLHPGSAPAERAANRLEILVNGDVHQLWQLIPLAAPHNADDPKQGDRRWLDALWQSADNSTPLPAALERMNCYLHYRIGKQRMWFTPGMRLNHHFEKWITRDPKAAILTAFAAAGIHATLFFEQAKHTSTLPLLTHSLAFVLPLLGASLLALQSLFAARALAFSFYYSHEGLLRQEANLRGLIECYQASPEDTARHRGKTEFQALVLHTEDALTQEMQSWILLNHRPEFEVTP